MFKKKIYRVNEKQKIIKNFLVEFNFYFFVKKKYNLNIYLAVK